MHIIEITNDNWEYYKNQILNLENKVKNDMIKQGIGDLFFTTGENIINYARDPRHHVYVMVNKKNQVLAQTYLIGAGSHIQGDYSDLPKYFTMGEDFIQYIKSNIYNNEQDFIQIAKNIYLTKLYAFKYAIKKIYGYENYNLFMEDLNKEKTSKTHFDERTLLRREINKYMSEFMKKHGIEELYRQFYNIDSNFANYNKVSKLSNAYDSFIKASNITIYNKSIKNPNEYFEANVYNTIEVDTYITAPKARKNGSAKILSTIALNKTITEFFKNSNSNVLYLSITLHKDNYLSENIANFLGFKDYIDLERRATIERKAYMKRIDKTTYNNYLTYLNKKLTYFYGYGNEIITNEEKELFEIEKAMHNKEIADEIDTRLKNEKFDDGVRKLIEKIRNNICNNISTQNLLQKNLSIHKHK